MKLLNSNDCLLVVLIPINLVTLSEVLPYHLTNFFDLATLASRGTRSLAAATQISTAAGQ